MGYRKGSFKNRICLICDKEFNPTNSRQAYCGNKKNQQSCSYKRWRNVGSGINEKEKQRITKYRKNHHFKSRYGITYDDYQVLLNKQNWVCAICGGKTQQKNGLISLNVDHDHVTGKVRGLLCFNCNTSLGKFKDDVNLLKKAINYLNDN